MKFGDNTKIVCEPVEENVSTWVPKGKNGHIRLEGTYVEFDTPLDPNGNGKTALKVLTESEEEALEKAMKLPKGWLSVYKTPDNKWTGKGRFKVRVGLDGKKFDTSDPYQYIQVKILEANRERIAPSYSQRLEKRYDFYIDKVEDVNKEANAKFNAVMESFEKVVELKDDKKKLESALLVLYKGDRKVIGNESGLERLRRLLYDFVERKPKEFLEIMDSPKYKYSVLLYRGLDKGAIIKRGFEYRLGFGDGTLMGKGTTGALEFLKDLAEDTENQARWEEFRNQLK